MNRLCIETRGIGSWRERLANPDGQWQREFSAKETAVSWEGAAESPSGLPEPILALFRQTDYHDPTLMFAIAEHKVPLAGRGGDSQCDVWALVNTHEGPLSLSVEAKAKEPFGQRNEPLGEWLVAEGSETSLKNRQIRWECIRGHLPSRPAGAYSSVPYQLLHRCAAAVIEALRLGLQHAAFVVQAFQSPPKSFAAFSALCTAMGLEVERGQMRLTSVRKVQLAVGWADCPLATPEEVARVA
jgi:hypothetical protein